MLDELLKKTKEASYELARLSFEDRNKCLELIKNALIKNYEFIIEENNKDIENAKMNNLSEAMIDRLRLDEKRINSLASSIDNIIKLEEVVNIKLEEFIRPNGIRIEKVSVPFGVIGVIFESRPNVCVDISVLCLKTANACVLKGGKEAINTNLALTNVMKEAIKDVVNPDCICLISSTDRKVTSELITKKEYIDLLIPRGGKGLIQFVVGNAKIPYIETGAGNCHLYVSSDADLDMALNIAINAKYQRPSVCNAIETIVIDEEIKEEFLKLLAPKFKELGIEIRGDEETQKVIDCIKATEDDYYTEYNDYIVSIKIVKDINEAIKFINEHSTKHSETIVTKDKEKAKLFLNEIDSACVYHNVSTRFSDGGEFGFGAEIGISTQKMHARGPMGLREICSYKYKIYGNGQVRG